MMINATEARAKTKEYLRIDAQEKHEKMQKFITDVIENAIIVSIENRGFSCFIKIPEEFDIQKVAELVRKHNYSCTTQHRIEGNYLLISW